ncbi:hypothetical protein TWF481_010869 [Arthrobotrys musiformis]|uniref:Mid2 domain-containing protein n=1 Tax=Arthrobotrys musiformis TaxID=47236 RepID=A0AAV9W461_9PEZI
MFIPSFSFLVLLCVSSALAAELEGTSELHSIQYSSPPGLLDDCSNSTHRWRSLQGSCFDEGSGLLPYSPLPSKRSFLDTYLGFIGLHPRDICGPDEVACWVETCCSPREICGSYDEGCTVFWSTIYSTTITTSWSTVTSWVLPQTNDVDFHTTTVNTTVYTTIFNPVTLPGEGKNDVLETDVVVVTKLVLSAFTPPAITRTEMVTRTRQPGAEITPPPLLMVRETGYILPRAKEIPRRWDGISYTTLTVFVTTFFTTSTIATLDNTVFEVTETNTISSIATQNQTHYETPTGFTTTVITQTETSTSYAYGTVETPTQVAYVTTFLPALGDEAKDGVTETASSGSVRRFSRGEISGITIGLILAVLLAVVAIAIFRRHRKTRDSQDTRSRRDVFDRGSSSSTSGGAAVLASPKPALRRVSQSELTESNTGIVPGSPISELFFSGLNMTDENKYSRNHIGTGGSSLSRGSRGSVVSSPVPEEYILPETPAKSAQIRSSVDERNWGRGYGGRGGYYNVGNRNTTLSDFGPMI